MKANAMVYLPSAAENLVLASLLYIGSLEVTAKVCYFGQEPAPDRPGRLLWTVSGTAEDRCSCTALRPGAVNTRTLGRPYEPFYTDRPLFTDDRVEIYDFFNCPEFATDGPGMQGVVPTNLEGTTTVSPRATTNLPVTISSPPSTTADPPSTTTDVPGSTTNPPDGAVRLVDGQTPNQGRVEIYYNGEWGTVCDDFWDITDGHVVCRQLGYPFAEQIYTTATHGQGTGPIHLDNTECTGSETRLMDCEHLGWGMHNCVHHEDASVKCTTTM